MQKATVRTSSIGVDLESNTLCTLFALEVQTMC